MKRTDVSKELSRLARKYGEVEVSYSTYCKRYTVTIWHFARHNTTGEGSTLLKAVENFKQKEGIK